MRTNIFFSPLKVFENESPTTEIVPFSRKCSSNVTNIGNICSNPSTPILLVNASVYTRIYLRNLLSHTVNDSLQKLNYVKHIQYSVVKRKFNIRTRACMRACVCVCCPYNFIDVKDRSRIFFLIL